MPHINLRLTEVKRGQSPPETLFFMLLHQTRASRRFLSTLTEFDLTGTLMGPKNPNFDSTIRMGYDQLHYEDYQITFPTTIHGSKSELKRLRYPKNRAKHVSTLSKTITFDSTV